MAITQDNFGRLLRQLIQARGISTRKFATIADISYSSLPHQMAKSEVAMHPRTLQKVIEGLSRLKALSPAERAAWTRMTKMQIDSKDQPTPSVDPTKEADALLATMLARHGATKTARALRGLVVMLDAVEHE